MGILLPLPSFQRWEIWTEKISNSGHTAKTGLDPVTEFHTASINFYTNVIILFVQKK